MQKRRWQVRVRALLEIALTLGFLTDAAALWALSFAPRLAEPLASVPALSAFMLISSLLLVGMIVLLLRASGESLWELSLGKGPVARPDRFLGVALVPAIFLTSYLIKSAIRHFLPSLYSGEANVLEAMMRTPQDLALFVMAGIVAGGIREEVQRAFVIRRFEKGWGPAWLGAALFAIYFGWGHLLQGKDEALVAGLLGLLWGVLYVVRGSIAISCVSHALYNALELVRYYVWGPLRYL